MVQQKLSMCLNNIDKEDILEHFAMLIAASSMVFILTMAMFTESAQDLEYGEALLWYIGSMISVVGFAIVLKIA